ncbi:MAG: hypothetical protein XD72_0208 [Methanothrix harundinacea]|jgi:hypothetical protein|uniref:Uncharacterized protein n=1 Tax=Methanothrix harundinacea TaxID=301375 RepID=A0A117MCW8_9EURY|nr:MAG: hypothetical protein XD72_0208 [Methanothrix harundinacea]KUK97179.1 MAG: hypothetical protein XE07_0564 [Methanothrix harundinacea]
MIKMAVEMISSGIAYPAFAVVFIVGTLLAYTVISLIGSS